jgi:CRP-like cAMP-binding protein
MPDRPSLGNLILDALPLSEFDALEKDLQILTFQNRQTVYRPNEVIDAIYFPRGCAFSVLTVVENGDCVEIATIGREGLSGSQLIFEAIRPESEMICQVEGEAFALPASRFMEQVQAAPHFRRLVFGYTESLFNFMGQSIACNRLHNLNERCARWLLSMEDRVGRSDFHLTQEFLAMMLGTARPAVTLAALALQQAGLISYHRGHVTIVDREGLVRAACECYAVTARTLARTIALDPA